MYKGKSHHVRMRQISHHSTLFGGFVHVADCVSAGRAVAEDKSAKKQLPRKPKECMLGEMLEQLTGTEKFKRDGAGRLTAHNDDRILTFMCFRDLV
jgi:hypothetical protein